tara:strand:- start:72 stop:317 length:246 start_codon:yes stop_codon:yes gene_type:complete
MEITKNYYTIDEEMEIDRYMEICDIEEWEAEHILKHIENVLERATEGKVDVQTFFVTKQLVGFLRDCNEDNKYSYKNGTYC